MTDPVTITLTESEADALHTAIVQYVDTVFDTPRDDVLTEDELARVDLLDTVLDKITKDTK